MLFVTISLPGLDILNFYLVLRNVSLVVSVKTTFWMSSYTIVVLPPQAGYSDARQLSDQTCCVFHMASCKQNFMNN